ncbi:SAM-dependent methyltransferase [Caldiplasma sukawensis]
MSTFYVIGSGPGDPELLTLKAHKILRDSKIIILDDLVDERIQRIIGNDVKCVRAGRKYGVQNSSRKKVLRETLLYGNKNSIDVSYVKNGDPGIFANIWDDIKFASEIGMEVRIIPGISSFLYFSGISGIPLTIRGDVSSFMLITATLENGVFNLKDVENAIKMDIPCAIFMGGHFLDHICRIMGEYGKGVDEILIVENASLYDERIVVFENLEEMSGYLPKTPCIIFIGGSVKNYEKMRCSKNGKLQV